ncbi:hypothetical protein Tter_1275 [Thermobaculum terrenum ATCC BAA-798]|uniref:Transmembrane protein n=1 Tax=Thermobaculum terrenum (strain ATCC BAA-798 / CCMEE 7001 / YNP1) TaxID=525904 RepID=D1CBL8_THET1|nr:hypothetical protein [Thermobaculum terrenum]ACZ42183.1 hypothetical protein Tter_1275 [Thermobaculum terrenum ATCC BAA-798]
MHKYEKEIEEIIARLESKESPRRTTSKTYRDIPPVLPRRRMSFSAIMNKVAGRLGSGLRDSELLISGVLLIFISSTLLSGLGVIQDWIAVIGAILFLLPSVFGALRWRPQDRPEKLWRGRPVDDSSPWDNMIDRFNGSSRDFRDRFKRR